MSIAGLLQWAVDELNNPEPGHNLQNDNPRLDAQVLLAFVLNKSRTYLMAFSEINPETVQIEKFKQLIATRKTGMPIAYILGEREFWSLPIYTNNSTLIPRPDTECLVELVLNTVDCNQNLQVVDLGTGTGAIALALAKECPNWQVTGIDFNLDAVLLAQKNASRNQLKVHFEQGSWLDNVGANSLDVIVSNPPYIDENDPHLGQGDVKFEPKTALVAGNKGFQDFEQIAKQALTCLKINGWLFFEHGYQQQSELIKMLNSLGYVDVKGFNDYSNQPRNVSARRP